MTSSKYRSSKRAVAGLMAIAATSAVAPACLNRPVETIEPRTTTTISEVLPQTRVDKIDILLSIDDSGSMADKQKILAVAVPDLVKALVNPPCVNTEGGVVSSPADPLAECPVDTRREFEPILDIHIGILSTSIGTPGSEACEDRDDKAHLISRLSEGEKLPTFEDKGFLAWDPAAEVTPAGGYNKVANLGDDLTAMVLGVGQKGCGYEAQLESWYRFLIDPSPYESIKMESNKTQLVGVDQTILEQRKAFLRPDSLVAIVMLSDENDCSYRATGSGWGTTVLHKSGYKGRQECSKDLTDPCCAPCGQAPEACPEDPTCAEPIPPENKLVNETCFDQKRRYGFDMLYPLDRYTKGLTELKIQNRDGVVVDNPLFVSGDGKIRGLDRVFLAGIVGVPWQLVARKDGNGNPSLLAGLQNAKELTTNKTWDTILGDPIRGIDASDPHMVESIHPRDGLPPASSSIGADPIAGHEFNVAVELGFGDLQHACIFDLPEPFECGTSHCDCDGANTLNNPLCQAPDGSYGTTQYRAKAYPSRRQLGVLEGVGDQGVVGSICPAQVSDQSAADFGYRPAIGAVIDRLKERLGNPCLSRSLTPNADHQVACVVLEGRKSVNGTCECDEVSARYEVRSQYQQVKVDAQNQQASKIAGLDCFCEIRQLAGEELQVCQYSLDELPATQSGPADGWCYIDAATFPKTGEDQLVAHCDATQRRTIRFVGKGEAVNDSMLFIKCNETSD